MDGAQVSGGGEGVFRRGWGLQAGVGVTGGWSGTVPRWLDAGCTLAVLPLVVECSRRVALEACTEVRSESTTRQLATPGGS